MKELSFDLAVGLGDLIHVRGLLESALSNYDQINLGFATSLYDTYRPENKSQSLEFLVWFAGKAFNHSKFNLIFHNQYGLIPTELIPGRLKLKFSIPPILSNFNLSRKILEDYIVVTTKVRDLWKEDFLKLEDSFFVVVGKVVAKISPRFVRRTGGRNEFRI